MTPYHYSVVRCRDGAVRGEHRNVGLLVMSPAVGKAWLRRGPLDQRAHLIGDEAAFVRALLDGLEGEAKDVAREGEAARVHDWLRGRSRPTEDAVTLSSPAIGIAADLEVEVRRLAQAYLGKAGGGGRTQAEKLRLVVLRAQGLQRRFTARVFESGPAMWPFPFVTDLPDGRPLVFNALQFGQKTPEGVLDAAFTNVGRAGEVVHHHPGTQWLTLAVGPTGGPTGRAFVRAMELMATADLNVVEPTEARVGSALARVGLLMADGAAEAR